MIGERLYISAATVKNHIYHIYRKTGVVNKVQLLNLVNNPK
jgi:DNA-binding CsgD family transcriptional regulator